MSREETIFGDDWPYSKAKSALLKSAAIVMREQGPRSATLKNIAGKAGVTEPAIFRHFDGVDGVFYSLFTVVELFYGKFVEFFADPSLVGLDRLESANQKILQTLKNNPDFAYVLAKPDPIFRQYAKVHAKLSLIEAKLKDAVRECFKEAKSAGQLVAGAENDAIALCVVGLWFQVLYSWVEDIDGYDPLKEGKKAISALCALARKPGTENTAPKPIASPKATAASKPKAAKKKA